MKIQPFSYEQLRLWVEWRRQSSMGTANIHIVYRLQGDLDVKHFKKCTDAIIRHEPIFNNLIIDSDEVPYFQQRSNAPQLLEVIDFKEMKQIHCIEDEICYFKDLIKNPFNLLEYPNFHIALYKSVSADTYYFCCIFPHILIDGYSCQLLLTKLAKLYNNKKEKVHYSPLQFVHSSEVEENTHQNYWEERLKDCGSYLNLMEKETDSYKSAQNLCEYKNLSENEVKNIKKISRSQKTTPFLSVLSIYGSVLYRYAQQNEFSILYAINTRQKNQKQNLGFYVNLLPLSFRFDEKDTLLSVIDKITQQRKLDKPHQVIPFSKILNILRKYRATQLDFNVLCSQSQISSGNFHLENVSMEFIPLDIGHTGHDLSLFVDVRGEKGTLCLEYNPSRYEDWYIHQLLNHIVKIIRSLPKCSGMPIHKLPLMTSTECRKLIRISENIPKMLPEKIELFDRLKAIADKCPGKIALKYGKDTYTYQALVQLAEKIAKRLMQYGVEHQDRIAVVLPRNHYVVAVIIAISKLRATFIPIDPLTPLNRIEFILNDAEVSHIICYQGLDLVDNFSEKQIMFENLLNSVDQADLSVDFSEKITKASESDLMYVIYTSGTTGFPKGVPTTYDSTSALFANTEMYFKFTQEDVWSLSHSFAFDFSVWEMWGALIHGATLIIIPNSVKKNPVEFYRFVQKEKITVLNITPSAFKQFDVQDKMFNAKLNLRYIIFGGEKLVFLDVKNWLKRRPQKPHLINMYGLTEAPIHATFHSIKLEDESYGDSLIGKPLPNTACYLVDKQGELVPLGVYGEICLSSPYIMKGYFNLNELNATKLIPNLFNSKFKKIYKTGDIARRLPTGVLNYYGRQDQQIQFYGHRIELNEINAVLQRISYIDHAVSIIYQKDKLHKYIVTFCIISNKNYQEGIIYHHLKKELPYYMIPSYLIFLEKIPLTMQGKINYPELIKLADKKVQQPQINISNTGSDYLSDVKSIWQEILHNEDLDFDSNYFDVNGDSINLLQLHHKLEKLVKRTVSFNELFHYTTIRKQAEYLAQLKVKSNSSAYGVTGNLDQPSPLVSDSKKEEVAIIGLALKLPGADTVEEFWKNLSSSKETIHFYSLEELKKQGIPQAVLSSKNYIRAKGAVNKAEYFDAEFFNYTDKEAEIIDPQHRLFLEYTWTALEDAGYVNEMQAGKIGVFASQSNINPYYLRNLLLGKTAETAMSDYQLFINNSVDFLSSRVAYKLNFTGPAITVQTGCSGSLVAVCEAANSLLGYQCDLAIAGGVALSLPLHSGYEYQEGMILSPDGHCRAFDKSANGTVPANGIGVVILKRLSAALQDRDHIYAVIKGYAINNDGNDKVGFTAPSEAGQVAVIQKALQQANCRADSIDYIEAHGTGTTLGDPIELSALARAMATRKNKYPCYIGSVKTNIGHLDGASGIAGLLKAILCLHHKSFVPNLHFKKNNSILEEKSSILKVSTIKKIWPARDYPRRAGVSSFAIGGTNVHMILQEPFPAREKNNTTIVAQSRLFVLSAKSPHALLALCQQFASFIGKNKNIPLKNISHTLQVGRAQFNNRITLIAQSHDTLAKELNRIKLTTLTSISPVKPDQFVFTFPGQGVSAFNGISHLYKNFSAFRECLDRCINIVKDLFNIDLTPVLFQPPARLLASTNKTHQLDLFCIEYALAQLWISWGIQPTALIGHSLGEYVAASVAEIWTLENSLRIINKRQELMAKLPIGKMLSVVMSTEELTPYLNSELSIAAINSPTRCSVAGTCAAIDSLYGKLSKEKIACQFIPVKHAYHTKDIDNITESFELYLNNLNSRSPKIPIISNLTGEWLTTAQATSPSYWANHMRNTVLFSKGVQSITQVMQAPVFIELGMGHSLTSFIRQHKNHLICCAPLDTSTYTAYEMHLKTIGKLWQQGFDYDWHKLKLNSHAERVSLPTYPFQRKRYWIDSGDKNKDCILGQSNTLKFYQSCWQYNSLNNSLLPHSFRGQVYLIFSDRKGLGQALKLRLERDNAVVYLVERGSQFCIKDKIITLEPNLKNYKTLFIYLKRYANLQFIYLWPLEDNLSATEIFKAQEIFVLEQLPLFQQIARATHTNIHLIWITTGLWAINSNDLIKPQQSLVIGPALTIVKEQTNVFCQLIDLPNNYFNSLDLYVELLQKDLINKAEKLISYRHGQRLVREFQQIELPETYHNVVQTNNVYLITGGLGHIGLTFAECFAKQTKVTLLLLQRTPFPEQADWSNYLESENRSKIIVEKIKRLQAIKKSGTKVEIFKADVANEAELNSAIQEIKKQHATIHGIIHAAGMPGGGVLSTLKLNEINQFLAAKVKGAINLHQATLEFSPQFMIYCSAFSAIAGDYGQSIYNAANAFLDGFAAWRMQQYGFTLSINWDRWLQGGMAFNFKKSFSELEEFNYGILDQDAKKIIPKLLNYFSPQLILSMLPLSERLNKDLSENILINTKTVPWNKESNALTKPLKIIWQQFLGHKNFSSNDNFYELGGDSLLAIQMASTLRKTFNIEFYPHNLIEYPTFSELEGYISKQLNVTKKSRIKNKKSLSVLVNLRKNNKYKPNLFLVHPIGGTVYIYQDLTMHLTKKINVYGLQAKALDFSTEPEMSVEKMAAQYLEAIKQVQPKGPYHLGGASFGGTIAYEMAQQLSTANESVETLILLDTPSPEHFPKQLPTDSDIIAYMLEVGAQHKISANFRKLSLEEQLHYFLQNAGGLGNALPHFDEKHLKHYLKMYKTHMKGMFDYMPVTYKQSSKVYYYRAINRDAINPQHPEEGWQSLLKQQIEVYQTPGNHISILLPPNSAQLAQKLNLLFAHLIEVTHVNTDKLFSW